VRRWPGGLSKLAVPLLQYHDLSALWVTGAGRGPILSRASLGEMEVAGFRLVPYVLPFDET
jgi:hypothetical protein